MITHIVRFALRYRFLIVLLFLAVCVGGFYAVSNMPIDAFPDISPNLVQVFAEIEGAAAEEVEQLVSRPVEVAMMGIPGVAKIRSISSHGLSTVNIYFEDDVDIYLAHQLVAERMRHAEKEIPEGLKMHHGLEKGPIVSGMGKILAYYLEGEGYSTTELRTLQDWVVKRNILGVPGVADVMSQGGHVRQYQVRVSPAGLLRYDLTIEDVTDALRRNNLNLGAGLFERGSEELMVRTLGLLESVEDIERVVIAAPEGRPIYIRDVATVDLGKAFRRGVSSLNGEGEVVIGNVYKLHGANSFAVIARLKDRIAEIEETLPKGVRVVPFYDQSMLVRNSIDTVRQALTLGLILVCLVSFVFLGNLRNALIVVLSLPFSMLLAFVFMYRNGMPGDLISFGGVAIALGMIVDATIVMIEKIQASTDAQGDDRPRIDAILAAAQEVGQPIFFAVSIIMIVFVPIFTLGGVEGKMFRPLAFAVTATMAGSLIYALAVAPVLASLPWRRRATQGTSRLSERVHTGYERLLLRVLPRARWLIIAVLVLSVGGVVIYTRLGKEFVPTLQEGTIQVLAHMNPNISLAEIGRIASDLEGRILEVPGVNFVLSEVGYGEVSPHVHHTNYGCITVELDQKRGWFTPNRQKEIVAALADRIGDYPGASISFSQPIQHELDALVAGAGATVVAKLFGPDLEVLRRKAAEIEAALVHVQGVADLRTEQFTGQTQVQIDLDDAAVARHGLSKRDVQLLIHDGLGGEIVGQIFEGQCAFTIDVRFEDEVRSDLGQIENMRVRTPAGYTVPVGELATLQTVTGLRQISREDTRRFVSVLCNVRGRDAGGFVEEAQEVIAEKVDLPTGYRLAWGGQFELQKSAERRLAWIVPVTLLAVLVMIYGLFKSVRSVLLIMGNIPLALVGGVFALALFGENVSVPSSIGFIALFGIALTNGLILVARFEFLRSTGSGLEEAVVQGAISRLRPVLMTAATTALGLLPLAISTGMGSEVQRPLAIVVIGGLVSSTLLTLFVLPTLYGHFARRSVQVEEDRLATFL